MFEPLRTERTFEVIARQLREAIYTERFKPGDKLPTERELANIFNASRAAVRSAVLNLEQSGLLQIRKGSGGGFFVREPGFEPVRDSLNELLKLGKATVSDLAEVRGVLEPEASRLAAIRAEPEDIESMEASIVNLKERMSRCLPRRPADFNFHICVATGAKNPAIILLIRALTDIIYQTTGSYVVESPDNEAIIDQHRRILDAIKAKDPETARVAALKHVSEMKALFGQYEGLDQ